MAKKASMVLRNNDTGIEETIQFRFTFKGIKKIQRFLKGNYTLVSVDGDPAFVAYMTNEIENYRKAPDEYKASNPIPAIATVTGKKVEDIKRRFGRFKR